MALEVTFISWSEFYLQLQRAFMVLSDHFNDCSIHARNLYLGWLSGGQGHLLAAARNDLM